ncbi:unnamed protein product, partial [Ascophyllum nodosum]
HFQYNSVCLGLAVAGAAAVSGGRFQGAGPRLVSSARWAIVIGRVLGLAWRWL